MLDNAVGTVANITFVWLDNGLSDEWWSLSDQVRRPLGGDGAFLRNDVAFLDGMVTSLSSDGASLAKDNTYLSRGHRSDSGVDSEWGEA